MPHNIAQCPLCHLGAWLRQLAVLRSRVEGVAIGKLEKPMSVAAATPLLKGMAVAFDAAGMKPLFGGTFEEQRAEKKVAGILSECAAAAEFVLLLTLGAKDGAAANALFDGLSAESASLAAPGRLDRSNYLAMLQRWKGKRACVARLGLTTPMPSSNKYASDHTFAIAKFEDHYAVYQSWVERFLICEPPQSVIVHDKGGPRQIGIPDVWSLDTTSFAYVVDDLTADEAYQRAFFMARPADGFSPIYRLVERDFDPTVALRTVKAALPALAP